VRSDPICKEESDPGDEVPEQPGGDPVEDEEVHDDAGEMADERRLQDEERDEGGVNELYDRSRDPDAEDLEVRILLGENDIRPHTMPE
jgi:hypothetical protein